MYRIGNPKISFVWYPMSYLFVTLSKIHLIYQNNNAPYWKTTGLSRVDQSSPPWSWKYTKEKNICIYIYKWTAWNHVPQLFLREIYRFQSSQSGIVVNPPVPVRHALRKELQTHDYLLTAKRVLLGKWKTRFIPFSK